MPLVVRCPTCKAEVPWEDNSYRPFCSERCWVVDLGAWADERYRIPGAGLEDESEDEDGDANGGSA
ncbi:MAG: DNA gyrase inhibitor YacG [Candidatus Binatia bacterium]